MEIIHAKPDILIYRYLSLKRKLTWKSRHYSRTWSRNYARGFQKGVVLRPLTGNVAYFILPCLTIAARFKWTKNFGQRLSVFPSFVQTCKRFKTKHLRFEFCYFPYFLLYLMISTALIKYSNSLNYTIIMIIMNTVCDK